MFPEHWDFPGGKLETDEDPFQGIEREILEETALISKATNVVGKYEMDIQNLGYPTHQFVLFNTETKLTDPVLSDEHTAFDWKTKNEILQLPIEPFIKLYFSSGN